MIGDGENPTTESLLDNGDTTVTRTQGNTLTTGLFALMAGNSDFVSLFKGVFGIDDINKIVGDDGQLDKVEEDTLLGTIGNFFISIGAIERANDSDTMNAAKDGALDMETASGVASIKALDGNSFMLAMHKASMIYTSRTEGIPLETLQAGFDQGRENGKRLACEIFNKCAPAEDVSASPKGIPLDEPEVKISPPEIITP